MNNNETIKAAEVAEKTVVLVELTAAQASAMRMMGFDQDRIDVIAKSTVSARIKSDFKRHREAESKVNAEIYDNSSRRGAKWPVSKDAYLKEQAKESASIFAEL